MSIFKFFESYFLFSSGERCSLHSGPGKLTLKNVTFCEDVSNPFLYLNLLLPIFLTDYSPWQRQLLDQIGVVLASAPSLFSAHSDFAPDGCQPSPSLWAVRGAWSRLRVKTALQRTQSLPRTQSLLRTQWQKSYFIISKITFKIEGLKLPITAEAPFISRQRLSYYVFFFTVFVRNPHLFLNKVNMFQILEKNLQQTDWDMVCLWQQLLLVSWWLNRTRRMNSVLHTTLYNLLTLSLQMTHSQRLKTHWEKRRRLNGKSLTS